MQSHMDTKTLHMDTNRKLTTPLSVEMLAAKVELCWVLLHDVRVELALDQKVLGQLAQSRATRSGFSDTS